MAHPPATASGRETRERDTREGEREPREAAALDLSAPRHPRRTSQLRVDRPTCAGPTAPRPHVHHRDVVQTQRWWRLRSGRVCRHGVRAECAATAFGPSVPPRRSGRVCATASRPSVRHGVQAECAPRRPGRVCATASRPSVRHGVQAECAATAFGPSVPPRRSGPSVPPRRSGPSLRHGAQTEAPIWSSVARNGARCREDKSALPRADRRYFVQTKYAAFEPGPPRRAQRSEHGVWWAPARGAPGGREHAGRNALQSSGAAQCSNGPAQVSYGLEWRPRAHPCAVDRGVFGDACDETWSNALERRSKP
jgi:hypothetical protein